MLAVIRVASATLSHPITVTRPALGSRIAQMDWISVVLPEPSGPTIANSSPLRISRSMPRRACARPKLRTSPRIATAGAEPGCGRGKASVPLLLSPAGVILPLDPHVDRHAGLEMALGIVDPHFHAEDELHALVLHVHFLGREFGLLRDFADLPREVAAGEGIGDDARRISEPDLADVPLGDEHAHV